MAKARVLILSGYGLNCETETLEAFESVNIGGDIVHVNVLIENPKILRMYQIFAIPGGFSFGDETGSGNALAIKIKNKLSDCINEFREGESLIIGICNGCQTLIRMFPEFECSLVKNKGDVQYVCDWVDVELERNTKSIWMKNLDDVDICKTLPVAHAEGRFYMSERRLMELTESGSIALRYSAESNPNGSLGNIAAVCDKSGKILCIMPHPERAVFSYQLNDWSLKKEERKRLGIECSSSDWYGFGYHIFNNASRYFNS